MVIPEAETEAALIDQAQNGNRSAYGEIVRRHHPGVIKVVFRMCGDDELAQDAAQEAFIQAWLHLQSFQTGASLRPWLYRIAINAALDGLRRENKMSGADLDSLPIQDPQDGLEDRLIQKEQAMGVQRAILCLTESCRAAIVLREYGALSYQEIADALDIPLGTVMSRLNYARRQLKQILLPNFIQMEVKNG